MSDTIFKVFHMISENEASELYIFNKKYKNEKLTNIPDKSNFNKIELSYVKSSTSIYTIDENIYSHDTINTIQEKLLKNSYIYNNIPIFSFYMYGLSKLKTLSPDTINFCCDALTYISIGIYIDDENYVNYYNNPYKNTNTNKFSIYTDNNKKLSNYNIHNNSIYFSTCDDIDDNTNMIFNYFPRLYELGINNKDQYLSQKTELIESNSKYLMIR